MAAPDWIPMPRYQLRRFLVRQLLAREIPDGRSCLELGFGAGDMLSVCASFGMRVYGYDFSAEARALARQRILADAAGAAGITILDDEDSCAQRFYDYVMAFEVLEHIRDDRAALGQFVSLLAPGGKLLLSVPAHHASWGRSDVYAGHYRRYEREDLRTLLGEAGVTVRTLWSYGYPMTLLLDRMQNRAYRPLREAAGTVDAQREELSRQSGIARRSTLLNRVASHPLVMLPFCHLQRLFLRTDLGSGYLALAERNTT